MSQNSEIGSVWKHRRYDDLFIVVDECRWEATPHGFDFFVVPAFQFGKRGRVDMRFLRVSHMLDDYERIA